MSDDLIKQIRADYPFPWGHVIYPHGLVQVVDTTGKEVPLFKLIEFASFLTGVMSSQKEKTA